MTDSFQNIAVTSFPDIVKIDFKSINNKYLKVILIHVFLVFFILFTALFIADYSGVFKIVENTLWLYLILFLVFIAVLALKSIGFKKMKYVVRKKTFPTKKGCFLEV